MQMKMKKRVTRLENRVLTDLEGEGGGDIDDRLETEDAGDIFGKSSVLQRDDDGTQVEDLEKSLTMLVTPPKTPPKTPRTPEKSSAKPSRKSPGNERLKSLSTASSNESDHLAPQINPTVVVKSAGSTNSG